jgi:hypothetical protein
MSSILKTNALESEAIYILERLFQFDKHCFFSEERFHYIGRLAQKHFFLQNSVPLLHVDTGHNFLKQLNLETDW